MMEASVMAGQQSDWVRTVVPDLVLHEKPPLGYRFCKISEVSSAHCLSLEDYTACLIDCLENHEYHRLGLPAVPANG